jgi:hypothetical protein
MPSKKASHWLTKAQREELISEYIECQEDMGGDWSTAEDLHKLDNTTLIKECVAFMPNCMQDLA